MKKSGIIISTIFGLAAVILSACNAIPILNNSNLVPTGGILYMDDFSNLKTGWPSWHDQNGSLIDYQASGLRILVNAPQTDLFARPGKNFDNARIEVDAVKIGGTDNNHFGILCRYQDLKNYYAFLITSDGYDGIVKVKDGSFSMLSGATLEYNQDIRQGQSQNHLRADCTGQTLSLWVNNHRALSASDATFSSGGIGLTAGSDAAGGVDLYFDNFIVFKP